MLLDLLPKHGNSPRLSRACSFSFLMNKFLKIQVNQVEPPDVGCSLVEWSWIGRSDCRNGPSVLNGSQQQWHQKLRKSTTATELTTHAHSLTHTEE